MPKEPTTYSKLSTGYGGNTSADSLSEDAYDLSWIKATGTDLALGGDATITGNVTATGGLIVGGGTEVIAISSSVATLDFGAIAVHDSSAITMALSGATRGDSIMVTPDSVWSGAYYDLALTANSGDTTGEINVAAANSTLTAVDPAAVLFRATRFNWASYTP